LLNYFINVKLESDIDFNLKAKHLGLTFFVGIEISSSKSLTDDQCNPPETYSGIVPQPYSKILNFLTLIFAKKADSATSISMYSRKMLLKRAGLIVK